MGDESYGIDMPTLGAIVEDIKTVVDEGVQVAVVIGAGNIFRGVSGAASGMDRANADYMGMLGTVINSLALEQALGSQGVPARVLSAIPMPTVCESYVRPRAIQHLEKGRVVIFAAGTGNPFFTTDTAAALRAVEMGCDVLLKGTQIDGVYSADPKKDSKAERFDRLSYTEVLARDLKVMDAAAISLARDNGLPVIVFALREPRSVMRVLTGDGRFTVIEES